MGLEPGRRWTFTTQGRRQNMDNGTRDELLSRLAEAVGSVPIAHPTRVAVDGPLLSVRLPDFFQLDLRIDRMWKRPWGVMNLYIDLQNVTNRQNVEGVTYNTDFSKRSYTNGLPIFPSIGVEYIP